MKQNCQTMSTGIVCSDYMAQAPTNHILNHHKYDVCSNDQHHELKVQYDPVQDVQQSIRRTTKHNTYFIAVTLVETFTI